MSCTVDIVAGFIGILAFFLSVFGVVLIGYFNADRLEKLVERKFRGNK